MALPLVFATDSTTTLLIAMIALIALTFVAGVLIFLILRS
jgi:hypothetical protein